jgi:tRNA A37 threonylcarbamoyladenosine biosynthesis protein TsaE
VEWGEKFAKLRESSDAEIVLERLSENERRIVFSASQENA